MKTGSGKSIEMQVTNGRVVIHIHPSKNGKQAKNFEMDRFIELDDLLFEGIGLWLGEGGKNKGLYFGNTSPELLLRFLDFSEGKLGLMREMFKVTMNIPRNEVNVQKRWSEILRIPIKNFTNTCLDKRINFEYAQIYFNSIVLAELMRCLQERLFPRILSNVEYAAPFLRGMFAAEGQVALRRPNSFHVTFSTVDMELVSFLKKCLNLTGIRSGKYMNSGRKFPIYGYRNLKRFRELGIHNLHPEKRDKFERGFASYKRTNVLNGVEARGLILQQLATGPKTYDDLAAALGKARTTIQAHHIPILERRGLVKRAGKRGYAWLWSLPDQPPSPRC